MKGHEPVEKELQSSLQLEDLVSRIIIAIRAIRDRIESCLHQSAAIHPIHQQLFPIDRENHTILEPWFGRRRSSVSYFSALSCCCWLYFLSCRALSLVNTDSKLFDRICALTWTWISINRNTSSGDRGYTDRVDRDALDRDRCLCYLMFGFVYPRQELDTLCLRLNKNKMIGLGL